MSLKKKIKRALHDYTELLFLYPLFWIVQAILQFIFNILYGPSQRDINSKRTLCYDVKINFKCHNIRQNKLEFFLLKYRGTVDPSVIEEDDVVLYDYSPKHFIFTRIRKGVPHWDIEKHPFTVFTSHNHAVQVITMPREIARERLKKREVQDGSNILLLHSIGRCGSTLLANLVYRTQQFHVISEPFAVLRFSAEIAYKSHINPMDSAENLEFIKSMFLLLCKKGDKRYFVKAPVLMTGNLFHLVHKALPQIKELFLHRSISSSLVSFKHIMGPVRFFGTAKVALTRLPLNYRRIWKKVEQSGSHERFSFMMLCQMHPHYVECKAGRNIRAFSFESMIEDKESFARELLSYLEVDEEKALPLALSAFSKDSQLNASFGRRRIGVCSRVLHSERTRKWVRTVAFEMFGIKLREYDLFATNVPNSSNGITSNFRNGSCIVEV